VLDQRGVADRFLADSQVAQAATFGTTVMDMSDFPTRHPYSLGIFQNQIERIMAAWIAELPVRIYYGCEVTGFAQDDTGVDDEGQASRVTAPSAPAIRPSGYGHRPRQRHRSAPAAIDGASQAPTPFARGQQLGGGAPFQPGVRVARGATRG
jgi:hypothetical protein